MQLYVSLCKFTIQDPAEKPIVSMACHLVTASLSWVPLPRTHELARPILSDPVSASTRENPRKPGFKNRQPCPPCPPSRHHRHPSRSPEVLFGENAEKCGEKRRLKETVNILHTKGFILGIVLIPGCCLFAVREKSTSKFVNTYILRLSARSG